MKNIIYLTLATAIFGSGVLTIDTAYGAKSMRNNSRIYQQNRLNEKQSEPSTIVKQPATPTPTAQPTAQPVKNQTAAKPTAEPLPSTTLPPVANSAKRKPMPPVKRQKRANTDTKDIGLSGQPYVSNVQPTAQPDVVDFTNALFGYSSDESSLKQPATLPTVNNDSATMDALGVDDDFSSSDEEPLLPATLPTVARKQRPAAKPPATKPPVKRAAKKSLLFDHSSSSEESSDEEDFVIDAEPLLPNAYAISQLIKGLKPDSQAGVLTILRADVAMHAIINNITNTQRNKYIAALAFACKLHEVLFSHLHNSIYTGDTVDTETKTMAGGFRLPKKAIVSGKEEDNKIPCDLLSWAETKQLFTVGYLKDEDSLNVVLDKIANATQDQCEEVDIANSFRLIRTILEFARFDRGGHEKYNEAVWCDGKDQHIEGGDCCIAEGKNYKNNGLTDDMIRAVVAILERCATAKPSEAQI